VVAFQAKHAIQQLIDADGACVRDGGGETEQGLHLYGQRAGMVGVVLDPRQTAGRWLGGRNVVALCGERRGHRLRAYEEQRAPLLRRRDGPQCDDARPVGIVAEENLDLRRFVVERCPPFAGRAREENEADRAPAAADNSCLSIFSENHDWTVSEPRARR
jgi:hypothetical protein